MEIENKTIKIVYLEPTIQLIGKTDLAYAQELIKSGEFKENKDKISYLLIKK
jgi:hypothetical protein